MQKQAVLTLEIDGDLAVVVRRDKNGRQVLYRAIPMVEDEIKDLFDTNGISSAIEKRITLNGVGVQSGAVRGLLKKESGSQVENRATVAGK